jgi:hypothetical protein
MGLKRGNGSPADRYASSSAIGGCRIWTVLSCARKSVRQPEKGYTYFILLSSVTRTGDTRRSGFFLSKPLNHDEIWMQLRVAERILSFARQIQQLEKILPDLSRLLRRSCSPRNRIDETWAALNPIQPAFSVTRVAPQPPEVSSPSRIITSVRRRKME